MIKSVFKEVGIMILICVVIVLVIGIIFYDYVPNNKTVPSKIAYETPKNVKQEIEVEITEYEKTNIVYEITDSDLDLYKSTKSYVPGKADPFADLSNEVLVEESVNNTGSVNGASGTSSSSSSTTGGSSSTTKNPDSTGTFFQDSGTK